MSKRIIRLTESELTNLIKKSISEATLNLGSMKDIMALQYEILYLEVTDGTATIMNEPSGCKKPAHYSLYDQGETNQCKINGSSLCSGPCFQRQAMDGIYGAKTKAAYEKYKDRTISFTDTDGNNQETTLEDHYSNKSGDAFTYDDWGNPRTNNWQIPANMTNIKAFQWYVWKKEDDTQKEDPNCSSNCKYKSILCGGGFCTSKQAIDGYWGTNTKKAWNKFKDQYFKDGYGVDTTYDKIPDNP